MKTKLYEALAGFIDAVANNDSETEQTSIKSYITAKTKLRLEAEKNNPVKLSGDDVMVDGKKVGCIEHDIDDKESSIEFESTDGKTKKEFKSLEELYSYVTEKFGVKEEGMADVAPAVSKQAAGRAERAKRMAKKPANKDGKAGDYDGGQDSGYEDPIKGGNNPAFSGHELDSRHKKGYYDSKDPRKNHKDKIKGGSEPAHQGGASDLETKGGYDAHDVRTKHNSK